VALALTLTLTVSGSAGAAQTLVDRVVARVGGTPVTLSDVRGGAALGLIPAREDDLPLATELWIQRLLLLAEVERFPPPEPAAAVIDQEVARMRQTPSVTAALRTGGVDERRLRAAARDTLRIRGYLDQRFGATRTPEAFETWMTDLRQRADVVLVPQRR
jgi:hypothetical protein